MEKDHPECYVVYLVWPERYLNLINWYKLGQSDNFPQRLSSYGPRTKTLAVHSVMYPKMVERLLKCWFRHYFRLAKGRETFEGDAKQMQALFNHLVQPYIYTGSFQPDPEIARRFAAGEIVSLPQQTPTPLINIELNQELLKKPGFLPKDQVEIILKNAHADAQGQFVCPRCQKGMTTKGNLNTHLTGTKEDCITRQMKRALLSEKCPRCEELFADKYIAKTHFEKNICQPKPKLQPSPPPPPQN